MSRRTNHHYDNLDDDDEDDSVYQLRSKVNLLKTVSIQIGEETRDQTRFLRQVDSGADSVWTLLDKNMQGVKRLANAGHNRIVFYLLAFAFFVVIVIYLMNKRL